METLVPLPCDNIKMKYSYDHYLWAQKDSFSLAMAQKLLKYVEKLISGDLYKHL